MSIDFGRRIFGIPADRMIPRVSFCFRFSEEEGGFPNFKLRCEVNYSNHFESTAEIGA